MNCPNCLREISDDALFCGYCGANIEASSRKKRKPPISPRSRHKPRENLKTARKERSTELSNSTSTNVIPKKKRSGVKIVVTFSILAIIAGSLFGFAFGRGVLDLRKVFPGNEFSWTDFSKGFSQNNIEVTENEDPSKK